VRSFIQRPSIGMTSGFRCPTWISLRFFSFHRLLSLLTSLKSPFAPLKSLALIFGVALILSGCGSGKVRKPENFQELRSLWSTDVGGEINYPASISVASGQIATATTAGLVSVLDVNTGKVVWSAKVKSTVIAGVGFDGERAALVTQDNDLIVLQKGQILWRQKLDAQSFTAPLVAGLRVFVLLADRSVVAFDGQSGKRLWSQSRAGDALVLKQDGVLAPFHNTLLAGFGGRLTGLDSLTGKVLWEAPLANPRGINDLERLVDLVGPVARVGDVVCTRAFQAQIGCVDSNQGRLIWTRPSIGEEGVSADAQMLVTIESNGQILSWNVLNGERLWDRDSFRGHHLTAPLVSAKGIFVGDAAGWVYLLSKKDGATLNRFATGTIRGFASAPAAVDSQHVVMSTKSGYVSQYYTP
jgi:outer membrane protein assembly factor BamB